MERAAKWVRRNPAEASLAGVTVLFLAVSVGGGVALGYSRSLADTNRDLESAKTDAEVRRIEAETQRERAESLLTERESLLYANRMLLAGQAWTLAHTARAEQLLDECPATLRGWEWHYLKLKIPI